MQKAYKHLIFLIMTLTLSFVTTMTAHAQPKMYGCGPGSTFVQWEWGQKGVFGNTLSFEDWLASSTAGTYILARVELDRSGVSTGSLLSSAQGGLGAYCYLSQTTSTIVYGGSQQTDEKLQVEFPNSLYGFSSYKTSTNFSGHTKSINAAVPIGSSNLKMVVAGYVNGTPIAISNSNENGVLPTNPSFISGGDVYGNGAVYSLVGFGYLEATYNDLSFPSYVKNYQRFSGCKANLNYTLCHLGPASASFAGYVSDVNKKFRADVVAIKGAGKVTGFSGLTAAHLPFVGIEAYYAQASNAPLGAELQLCIGGGATAHFGKSRCGGGYTPPEPPKPAGPGSCYLLTLQDPTYTFSTSPTFTDFTLSGSVRYADMLPFTLAFNCDENAKNFTLRLSDNNATCTNGIAGNSTQGVLCNYYVGGQTLGKANVQVLRANRDSFSDCTQISNFSVVSLGTTIANQQLVDTNAFKSSNLSSGLYNYGWSFCARYYTTATSATALGQGIVQGQMQYTLTYD